MTFRTFNPRKHRGKNQKIFLVLTHDVDDSDPYTRKYDVMGTTRRIYTVTITKTPSCTCPDHVQRKTKCKHIFFILTRIMKIDQEQEDNETYTEHQLTKMFKNIPEITNNLKINNTLLNKYNNIKNNNGLVPQIKITHDDICVICLEELLESNEKVIYCRSSCGKSIHHECFSVITNNRFDKCVFCQQIWDISQFPKKDNYISL